MSESIETYVIKKNSWGRFGRIGLLWDALKGRRSLYLLGIAALAMETLFSFTSPIIVKTTIDSIIGKERPVLPFFVDGLARTLLGPELGGGGIIGITPANGVGANGVLEDGAWLLRPWLRENLWVVAVAFIACILCQSAFSFVASYSANNAAEHAAKRMRDRLYAHVQNLPYETLLRSQSGDWFQRCTSDVDTSRRFLCFEFMEICRTLFLVGIAYPVMFTLSPSLTLWGSLVVPLIILYSVGFHLIVERVFLGADEREAVLSGIIQENVNGVRVVRAFARQDYEMNRFSLANDRYRDQVFKLIVWLGLFWGVSSFLGLLQIALVTGAGLFMMAEGSATLGLLVMFLNYEHKTLWPIRMFGRVLADTGKTKVALGRMAELLVLPEEEDLEFVEGEDIPFPPEKGREWVADDEGGDWLKGPLEFDHVCFSYPDGTKVLEDITFRMERGEHLAVVGPTGSGKSTLVLLLLRLYEPTSGCIRLGGRDIRTIPKRELRRGIALVLQEGFLFGKTIRENIRLGRMDAGEEMLLGAARKAALHKVIEEFPGGYDTMVGERGVTLSGGQRQRLSLARALVRQSPLLVLDDSMSAVDTETDRLIRESIEGDVEGGPGTGTGMIIIAHRLTTLASADRILVLEGGRITALGSHAELVGKSGLYRRLAELQSAVGA